MKHTRRCGLFFIANKGSVLTLIEDLEAAVRAAVVGGKEHVEVVAAAEQKLRHLCAIK